MERIYQGLPLRELGGDAGFRRPTQPSSERVTLESPALGVMTDFTRATPATIRPQAPLAGANQFMITRGVRLLLVVDEHESVLGVLTANDLLGERSMLAATGRDVRRDELTVADVMTPAERVEVIELAEVGRARATSSAPRSSSTRSAATSTWASTSCCSSRTSSPSATRCRRCCASSASSRTRGSRASSTPTTP